VNFLSKRFGGRKAPTSDTITKEIEKVDSEITAARSRLAEVDKTLQNLAVLSDAEHEAAEIEQRALLRSIARLEAQSAELQAGLVEAQKAERCAALEARSKAVRRLVEVDAPKALDRYEAASRDVAEAGTGRFHHG
jgi:hypothetical protein